MPYRKKYNNKKTNAKKEGVQFLLSYDEYVELAESANISPQDISIKGYHLSRFGDQGPYAKNNCRFLYYTENYKEKNVTEKMRLASAKNIRKANIAKTPEEMKRIASLGGIAAANSMASVINKNRLSEEEINRRLSLIATAEIDLQSYGWVSKVSTLLGITHTHVRRFMEKNYKGKLYSRRRFEPSRPDQ